MRQVVGYFDKTFDSDFLTRNKVLPGELVGSKMQLCFGRVAGESKVSEENPDDIIEKMLSKNISTLVEYDEANQIAKIMFEHKIPEDIFVKYYGKDKEIIFE